MVQSDRRYEGDRETDGAIEVDEMATVRDSRPRTRASNRALPLPAAESQIGPPRARSSSSPSVRSSQNQIEVRAETSPRASSQPVARTRGDGTRWVIAIALLVIGAGIAAVGVIRHREREIPRASARP